MTGQQPSAFEALPQIPLAKAIAQAAANEMTVRAVDASSVLFVLVGHPDGRVDLNSRLGPAELAATLRQIAEQLERDDA